MIPLRIPGNPCAMCADYMLSEISWPHLHGSALLPPISTGTGPVYLPISGSCLCSSRLLCLSEATWTSPLKKGRIVRYSLLCATPMHVRTPTLRTVMRPPSRGAQAHLLCSGICSSRCLLSRHACLTPVSPTLPGLYSIYSSAGHSQAENTLLAINALVISQS